MNGDEWNESPFLYGDRHEIDTRAEVGESAVERCHAEERAIARVGASYREGPPHGAVEPTLPRDALEDEARDRDAAARRAGHDKERGGRSADRRKRGRDLIDLHPTERRVADVDDDEAEALAAQSRGRRERDTRAPRAYDNEPLEINARALRGERIERRRRIDPGGHPTLRLCGCGRPEGELKLANARWTDERDGLAGDEAAADDAIE